MCDLATSLYLWSDRDKEKCCMEEKVSRIEVPLSNILNHYLLLVVTSVCVWMGEFSISVSTLYMNCCIAPDEQLAASAISL